ncbi:hypothetical protein [Afipia felis]|uniref:Uncharacterized protein n=2 Tax=Afipia felis TaxID=1035 RepID=A0A380WBQ4_AFIFE|nr:hypothetical protein [Afipia felis]EKS29296.1 hypothetical protein HMPREF9697_01824 [Afipia felis ATCC 53690]SUU78004.1 Uncharacterised protein [Afipia felis]SUU86069.1 Uncharacterised protein [Afipia felis]
MNNITNLSTYAAAHPRLLPLASAAVITLQQALASGTTAASIRAVADWNERKSYDERRRKARSRQKAQAAALRVVADQLGGWQVREAA